MARQGVTTTLTTTRSLPMMTLTSSLAPASPRMVRMAVVAEEVPVISKAYTVAAITVGVITVSE